MMNKHFIAALLIAVSCLARADWSGEIAGVKLGMTAEQAKAAITKAVPKLQIEEKKTRDGALWGYVAMDASGADNKWGADYVVAALDDGKVWYVGRRQVFPEGGRPTVNAFFDALEQKYDKFNVFPDSGREKSLQQIRASGKLPMDHYSGAWIYDRSGKADERACQSNTWEAFESVPIHTRLRTDPALAKAGLHGLLFADGTQRYTGFGFPTVATGTCGRRAMFYVSTGPNGSQSGKPEFVGSMSIWAADMAIKYDRVMAQKKAAEDQKKQAAAAELGKNVKPSF